MRLYAFNEISAPAPGSDFRPAFKRSSGVASCSHRSERVFETEANGYPPGSSVRAGEEFFKPCDRQIRIHATLNHICVAPGRRLFHAGNHRIVIERAAFALVGRTRRTCSALQTFV